MAKPYIPLILGTGRQGRESEKVAKYVWEKMQAYVMETEFIDVRDFAVGLTVPHWEANERLEPWRTIVKKADGFILVFPEYHHGYPGELKILLDSVNSTMCARKPILLCSVSSGNFGGVRAADHLLPVLRELKLVAMKESVIFPNVETLMQKSKAELDEIYDKKINDGAEMLLKYAEALKPLRIA